MGKIKIFTDGGSRGNPGLAGIGIVMYDDSDNLILEVSQYLGEQTNNVAEYKGLVRALELALEQGISDVEVFMDSELVVKQLIGEYRVKNERMIPFYQMAVSLRKLFNSFKISHIKREKNKEADKLANNAMDTKDTTITTY